MIDVSPKLEIKTKGFSILSNNNTFNNGREECKSVLEIVLFY